MAVAIEARRLKKVYDGKTKALDGVDLQVRPAEVFALLGPNGSGKRTLRRILTTQFRPTSGEARNFGLDVVSRGAEGQEDDRRCPPGDERLGRSQRL